MSEIKNRLQSIHKSIVEAEKQAKRPINSVQLLAVSKTWPAEILRHAVDAGQRCFGENYLQEALSKINALSDLNLEWHFIGPIQSNKTKDIAQNFNWVQSVDRLKIAQRLAAQRPQNLPAMNICIQVNIDNEQTKSGISTAELLPLAKEISQLDNLVLRGLLIIPAKTDDPSRQRDAFHRAYQLYTALQQNYPSVDTLSMGMTADMEAAITEGSTMVRIGAGLFGQRTTSPVQ